MTERSNFYFLQAHAPILLELAQGAERAFVGDPNTTLVKLRQLSEALAQDIAMRSAYCTLRCWCAAVKPRKRASKPAINPTSSGVTQ